MVPEPTRLSTVNNEATWFHFLSIKKSVEHGHKEGKMSRPMIFLVRDKQWQMLVQVSKEIQK